MHAEQRIIQAKSYTYTIRRNVVEETCYVSHAVYISSAFVSLCCVALRCVALRCVALRCVALRCVALRCVALRCVALRCVALRCVALRCVALRCVALRCVALRCVALRCVALRCVALRCVALRTIISYKFGRAYNASDTSLHTAHVAPQLTRFSVPHRRQYSANARNGTSVVDCSSVKLSSKLN